MLSHSFTLLVILVISCSKECGGEYLRKEGGFIVIAFSFILEAEFLFLESYASYFYIYVDITISRNTEPVYDAAMILVCFLPRRFLSFGM